MFAKLVTELKGLMPVGSGSSQKQALLERRNHTRISCKLEIECRQANRDHQALALNVSANGVAIEVDVPLDAHQDVYLSYRPKGTPLGRQRLKCRVVWSRPGTHKAHFVGLKFTDEQPNVDQSWAHFYMKQTGFNPHRAFRRESRRIECLDLRGQLTEGETARFLSVAILDLGLGGARLTSEEKLDKNLIATLQIEGADQFRLLSRIIHVRALETGFQVNIRFLNQPDSVEIVQLGQFLLQMLPPKRR